MATDSKTEQAGDTQALATRPSPSALLGREKTMGQAIQGLIPTTYGETMEMARFLVRSELVPRALRAALNATPQQIEQKAAGVMAVVMTGMELGLTPMRALKQITLISGTMSMASDLQLAVAKRDNLVAFTDEGFETKGTTDLADDGQRDHRVRSVIRDDDPEPVKVAKAEVIRMTRGLADGKVYGWTVMQRKGDDRAHARVFTQDDAERVTFTDWEDDTSRPKEGGEYHRKKVTKKLTEKDNYKNYPQDMYPKRARTRLMGFLFPDSMAGIPSTESLEGAVIEGEVVHSQIVERPAGEPTVDDYLATMTPEDAKTIRDGFAFLKMGPAKQLVELKRHAQQPAVLIENLRAEAEQRKGVPPEKRHNEKTKTATVPAEGTVAGQAVKAGDTIAVQPATGDVKVIPPAPSGRVLTKGADGRFRYQGRMAKFQPGDTVVDGQTGEILQGPGAKPAPAEPAVATTAPEPAAEPEQPEPPKPGGLAGKAKAFGDSF